VGPGAEVGRITGEDVGVDAIARLGIAEQAIQAIGAALGGAARRQIEQRIVTATRGHRRCAGPCHAPGAGAQQALGGGALDYQRRGVAAAGDGALDDGHGGLGPIAGDHLRDDVRKVAAAPADERIRRQRRRHAIGLQVSDQDGEQ